ncbi:DUF3800 domain-containing protein [Konateibacter massiliensis]|uniref:DUF3800 domain-containing protein n=1 Tax=Konateibacter massiliensis TaxID=2002841 RepID=UPI000C146288|nr:DUF3800 domain-containing protein [Konateibacter massiliensis]
MLFDIYCDESRQDLLVNKNSIKENNKYCCIGGLMAPNKDRATIKQRITNLCHKHQVYGELKWGSVSNNKLLFYVELIELFFELEELNFRTIVIDAEEVNNTLFNNSDQELGYYKFYYQLLNHWLESNDKYRIYTDFKTNKERTRLEDLKMYLNKSSPIERVELIQAINSKESVLLQMQNVIMGAVCYYFNYGKKGDSVAKNVIINTIEENLGHSIKPTNRNLKKFNVFKIDLQKGEC